MEERGYVESLVLSCFYQDLCLVSETNLKEDDFTEDKTYFFYCLAKALSTRIESVSEIDISSFCTASGVLDQYHFYGGYESVKRLIALADVENFENYVDDLKKIILVENLKNKRNFDIYDEIEYGGRKIIPAELLPYMSASQFHEYIQILFTDLDVETDSNDFVVEEMYYSDQEIQDKLEGKKVQATSPIDITLDWYDEDGKYRYIKGFPITNSLLNGAMRTEGIHLWSSGSGTGKSTVMANVMLSLITSGNKVILFSNEVSVDYYKQILCTYVAHAVFKGYSLSRKKIAKAIFDNEEEKEIWIKSNEFLKEKILDNIKFVRVTSFNLPQIFRLVKKLRLTQGYNYMILDTLKSTDSTSNNEVGELVDMSRKLDEFSKKEDVGVFCTYQLLTSQDRVSYLSNSQLVGSKQVIEVCHTSMLMRRVKSFELDPENKRFFLQPYTFEKDGLTGKYREKEIKIKNTSRGEGYEKNVIYRDRNYLLLFVAKNRSGECDKVIIAEFNGVSGMIREIGYCKYVNTGLLTASQ